MSPAFTPPVRFSRLVLKVNTFLLVGLLMVLAFLGLVAYKQAWFVPQASLHFVTPSALGINRGMPVKLYGFTVGSVSEMRLAANGVEVQVSIVSEHLPRIRRGSRAKLAREAGVVGASVIEILPARDGAPLSHGERLGFEPSRGLSEIIDDIRREAVPAFEEMKQVLSRMNRSSGDVAALLASLREEAERLPATHEAMRALVEEGRRAVAEIRKQAGVTLASAGQASGSVAQTVPQVGERLRETLGAMHAAAGELERTGAAARDALRRMQPLIERSDSAVREASEVLGAVKRVWPLSGSVAPPADATLAIDSFEADQAARPR